MYIPCNLPKIILAIPKAARDFLKFAACFQQVLNNACFGLTVTLAAQELN